MSSHVNTKEELAHRVSFKAYHCYDGMPVYEETVTVAHIIEYGCPMDDEGMAMKAVNGSNTATLYNFQSGDETASVTINQLIDFDTPYDVNGNSMQLIRK